MSIAKRILEMKPSKRRNELEEALGFAPRKVKKRKVKTQTEEEQAKLDL